VKFFNNDDWVTSLSKEESFKIQNAFYDTLGFFHWDGVLMQFGIKGNNKHLLFYHYILMCQTLSGFEEKVSSKLPE
jgi:hypothetical protein